MQKSFRISFFYLVSKDYLILVIARMNCTTKSKRYLNYESYTNPDHLATNDVSL